MQSTLEHAVQGDLAEKLKARLDNRTAKIGIMGLGYVGLPLALLFSEQKFPVTGFDIDKKKVDTLNTGGSYIYRITKDLEFARSVYPAMQKGVVWLQQARRNDPLHLMPNTSPGDNENITGHVTGHNFWALIGLKNVIAIANALGRTQDARAYQAEYDDLKAAFLAALKKATAERGGFIPPGVDVAGGLASGQRLPVVAVPPALL